MNTGYGAGRRVCPGMHLAERSMWRIAAKLLWAFEFSEPRDPVSGQVLPLDPNAYSDGVIQTALDYEVVVKPRSQEHVAVIKEEQAGALRFLSSFE